MEQFILEIALVVSNFFLIYLFLIEKKKEKQLKEELQGMFQTMSEQKLELKKFSQKKLVDNKRKAFRVMIPEAELHFRICATDSVISKLLNKRGVGYIQDISYTGIKFTCDYDLPVRHNIMIEIEFTINNESFILEGLVIRKESHKQIKNVVYGASFINVSPSEEKRLMKCIHELELQKKKG